MTDGEGQYRIVAPIFASHEVVNHSGGEYVRGEAHTNTVEGYFSILKRGIIGTFHHVSPDSTCNATRPNLISATTTAKPKSKWMARWSRPVSRIKSAQMRC